MHVAIIVFYTQKQQCTSHEHVISTTDQMQEPPTCISISFTATPGRDISLPRRASPLQYLELFMTMGILQYIIQTTNIYAADFLSSVPHYRSVFCNWRNISLVEMRAFLGVIIQIGLVQLYDIKDYWSRHVTLNLPFCLQYIFQK